MLSTRDFFTFQSKGLLQHTVSELARLTFHENLSIGARNKCPLSALTGIRIKPVEFRENVWAAAPNENIVQNHLNITLLNVF